MTDEIAPNCDLVCNLCGKKISHVCMMSPNWSALESFKSLMPAFRYHLLQVHGIKPPLEPKSDIIFSP